MHKRDSCRFMHDWKAKEAVDHCGKWGGDWEALKAAIGKAPFDK